MAKTYKRIRDLREDNDMKQSDVAEQLGLYSTQYQRYERGEVSIPIDFFVEIAKLYNVSIDYLAELTDTPKTLDGKPYKITNKNITINNQ